MYMFLIQGPTQLLIDALQTVQHPSKPWRSVMINDLYPLFTYIKKKLWFPYPNMISVST